MLKNQFLFIALFLFTSSSFALAKLGHKVVCATAFNQLPLATQQEVSALLATIPNKQLSRINKYNHQNKLTPLTFASACTWADAIKNDDTYALFKSWHYLNVPRNISKVTMKNLPKSSDNIVSAILFHQRQLSTNNNAWEKLQALMFLGHWLGDIHQPLHVSFASDLGGNKIQLKHGQCTNLHWYWDDCLLSTDKGEHVVLLQNLIKAISNLSEKQAKTPWHQSEVYRWASESLVITRQAKVQYCQLQQNNYCLNLSIRELTLPSSYQQTFKPVLQQRLAQASIRLAAIIEASFE